MISLRIVGLIFAILAVCCIPVIVRLFAREGPESLSITRMSLVVAFFLLTGTVIEMYEPAENWTISMADTDQVYEIFGVSDGKAYYNTGYGAPSSISTENAITGAQTDAVRVVKAVSPSGLFSAEKRILYLTDETAGELGKTEEE